MGVPGQRGARVTSAPDQPPDDDPTVPVKVARRRSGNALPDGTHLAEFEIRGVIGEGGFGIVYLAWDWSLQRQVAIKEYMPSTLAARTLTTFVSPRSDKLADTFALGLRSFVNEAQLLASFDHPSLLKVYRFWEANGTAYMVMPYYQGVTLKRALAALTTPPEEGWLLKQLSALLDALDVMHRERCYHRDIAPDNILLLDDGRPLLLDFGAARRVIGDATQALTAFLKPGYAPVEQYAEMPSMKQGPWTDFYALGSVVHYAITGHTPPESVARLVNDTMVPLAKVAAGRYSERFLRAIDHALAVRPDERPQSAAQMRAELGIQDALSRVRKSTELPMASPSLDAVPVDDTTRPPLKPTQRPPVPSHAAPSGTAAWPAAPRTVSPWLFAAAGLALIAALASGWWWLLGSDSGAAVHGGPASREAAPATAARNADRAAAPTAASAPGQAPALRPSVVTGVVVPQVEAPPVPTPPPATPSALPSPTGAPPADERPAAVAVPSRPTPKKNSPNPRCTEIIARVSLGEALSAQDQATLQGECRK